MLKTAAEDGLQFVLTSIANKNKEKPCADIHMYSISQLRTMHQPTYLDLIFPCVGPGIVNANWGSTNACTNKHYGYELYVTVSFLCTCTLYAGKFACQNYLGEQMSVWNMQVSVITRD